MNALISLSIAMAAGLLMTRPLKLLKLPNVTAFLLAGLLIGPSLWGIVTGGKFGGIVTADTMKSFDVIVSVALGFIAFSIGGEFRLSDVRKLGKQILLITVIQALGATFFVFGAVSIAGFAMPEALALGAIATATAPAATLLVVRQYKADGPVTRTLLPVVAFDDAIGLIIFSIFMSLAKAIESGEAPTVKNMLVEPLCEILLSLIIGALLGVIVALCAKWFKSRANRLSVCIATVIAGVGLVELFSNNNITIFGVKLSLSSLLLCMMAGAVFCNLSSEYAKVLEGTDRWTPPLFMLFFVISGADLDLSLLPKIGIIGVLYLIFRSLGKYFGARLGATLAGAEKNVRKYLGITLLPQAGVAIGMAQIAVSALPEHGASIQAVVLCATLIYEIVGPVLTKIALKKAGEIRADL